MLELVYTIAATRLSIGQQFKYYLDETIYTANADKSVYDLLDFSAGENGKTFSYDVLSVETENLTSSYNVLSVRLSVQEGDAIFTSSVEEEGSPVRARTIIDDTSVYDMFGLLESAKTYLGNFTVSGGSIFNENDYDENKIRGYFDERMKGDKRFRTEEEKEEGRKNEIARIKKLAKDTGDFEYLLSIGEEKGLFYRYTRFEQIANNNPDNENYANAYQRERDSGRENLVYGFNMSALTGGKKNVSEYLKLQGKENAEGVVLLLFDFASFQPDLQYESISFFTTLAREFSDFLG